MAAAAPDTMELPKALKPERPVLKAEWDLFGVSQDVGKRQENAVPGTLMLLVPLGILTAPGSRKAGK